MKKYVKWTGIVILSPVILFVLLSILIYLPPVQKFLVSQVTRYASEATDMQIQVGRLSLSFPLDLVVSKVKVIDKQDTILAVDKLTAKVQLLPLLQKEVELDGLELKGATVNTAQLIEGMKLKGYLGEFFIESHGVSLSPETAIINSIHLKDTHLDMNLSDTTATDTTSSAPLYWKIKLLQADMENVSFNLDMPLDTIRMSTGIGKALLKDGIIDLQQSSYTVGHLTISQGKAAYHSGSAPAHAGLDPSHIEVSDINLSVDSVYYAGNDIRANIHNFGLKERSGLEILSTQGQLLADKNIIRIPSLELKTLDSYLSFDAMADWSVTQPAKDSRLSGRLFIELGKSDLFKLVPDMPEEFIKKYPSTPLQIRAGIDGTIDHLALTGMTLGLEGYVRMTAEGEILNVMDSLNRKATVHMDTRFTDTRFLEPLTGGIIIPTNTLLKGLFTIEGEQFHTTLQLTPQEGEMLAKANYHLGNEQYDAEVAINELNLHPFMPADSLFHLSAVIRVKGEGTDFFSPKTSLQAKAEINHIQYGNRTFSGIALDADFKRSNALAQLNIKDNLANVSSRLEGSIHPNKIKADLTASIQNLNLQELQLTDKSIKISQNIDIRFATDLKKSHQMQASLNNIQIIAPNKTFKTKDILAGFTTAKDSLRCYANAGDLTFLLGAKGDIDYLSRSIEAVTKHLDEQWKAKSIDQDAIRKLLPEARFRIFARNDNPLSNLLSMSQIQFNRLYVNLTTSPVNGLNGEAYVYGLQTDSLQLDTLYFNSSQNPEKLVFTSGVKANKTPYQDAFDISLNGDIGSDDAHLTIEYLNDKKQQGAYLGLVAALQKNGISIQVSPNNPTLVYRTFHVNPDNYIYLGDNGRIHADLKLFDDQYTGLQFYSTPDSTAQQDLTLQLNRIDIAEFRRIIPYMPDIAGLISAEAHYIQQEKISHVSLETQIEQLYFNQIALGDWAFSGVYLPKETGEHRIDGFVTLNDEEIASLNGSYFSETESSNTGTISANMNLHHFPLDIANPFIPDKTAKLSGDIDGTMGVSGQTDKFLMNGSINLDDVGIEIPQASLKLRFDNRPVEIKDSKLTFDNFSIFTQGKSPFTIDGTIDMANLADPTLDLRMNARNFELINSKRTKESLIYGKLYVDFSSILKGNMEELTMRGNMNVLGSSDFTYILKDSPLTVEDKLAETVTFVNFNDTTTAKKSPIQELSLGGLNMLMTMHIDEAVQAKIDLTPNGSNYMLLEGGGDLSFQYTPEGSMLLNGRYSLMSGEMKYELPVIPLKTFYIRSGSYIEWTGNIMNPNLNIQASERVRAAVSDSGEGSRNVNFDVGVNITNRLENLGFTFTLEAPDDGTLQNELASMSAEERNKLAVTMLVTGMYMGTSSSSSKFDANSALNSFLQSEINNIAGSALKSVDVNFGMETNSDETGGTSTDYNFQFAKRFWNNRFQIVIGGKISSGNNVNESESFIDNVSLEYRLDNSGTRYIKIFHDKNYESILEGEVIETGVGIVLRKKVSKLGELFIFRKREKATSEEDKEKEQNNETEKDK